MTVPELLAPVFFVISMSLIMIWFCIKLENMITNEKALSALSWASPLFIVVAPISLTFYYFGAK